MTSRIFLRLCMLAIGMIATLSFLAPDTAQAQLPCACARVRVLVSPDVGCRIVACIRTNGGEFCDTVAPGGIGHLRCDGQFHIYLVGCNGQHYPVDTMCVGAPVIPIRPGCCVHACLQRDPDYPDCWAVVIRPAADCACP